MNITFSSEADDYTKCSRIKNRNILTRTEIRRINHSRYVTLPLQGIELWTLIQHSYIFRMQNKSYLSRGEGIQKGTASREARFFHREMYIRFLDVCRS